jgi:hypothetical protein
MHFHHNGQPHSAIALGLGILAALVVVGLIRWNNRRPN